MKQGEETDNFILMIFVTILMMKNLYFCNKKCMFNVSSDLKKIAKKSRLEKS